jgi:hypothetical protein
VQTLDVLTGVELVGRLHATATVLNADLESAEAIQLDALRVLQLILHGLDQEKYKEKYNFSFISEVHPTFNEVKDTEKREYTSS